jgi:hypothetical protein
LTSVVGAEVAGEDEVEAVAGEVAAVA